MPYTMDRQMFMAAAQREEIEVRDHYSGRGMYGASCPAVVCEPVEWLRFITNIAADSEDTCITEEADWLIEHFAYDSMGRSVVYYWPGLTLE
jgi:hypothetical protein